MLAVGAAAAAAEDTEVRLAITAFAFALLLLLLAPANENDVKLRRSGEEFCCCFNLITAGMLGDEAELAEKSTARVEKLGLE